MRFKARETFVIGASGLGDRVRSRKRHNREEAQEAGRGI